MTAIEITADAAEQGFDPARLARVDDFIRERYLDTGRYPGFGLAVARGGEVVHLSSQGHRRVDGAIPWTDETVVRLYSMSKPITSVALMILAERAMLSLNDDVGSHLDGWNDLRVWVDGTTQHYGTRTAERPMRVKDLLTHTSGLTYGWMGRHPVDGLYRRRRVDTSPQNGTLADFTAALAEMPLLFDPGSQWSYSVATDVVGALVEVVSGVPYDEFLRTEIFEPLGMHDIGFTVSDEQAERFAANYAVPALSPFGVPEGANGDDAVEIDRGGDTSPYRRPATFFSGGGGLCGTMGDYHRFCQMLANGGELDGRRILSPLTVANMASNHMPGDVDLAAMGQPVFSETRYDGIGFGLGFSVVIDPPATGLTQPAGSFAWGGAASTLFWIDPVEDLHVIGLTQLMPSSAYAIRDELKQLVYAAIVE